MDTLDVKSHNEVISFVKTIKESFRNDLYNKIESEEFQYVLERYERFIPDSTAHSKTFAY